MTYIAKGLTMSHARVLLFVSILVVFVSGLAALAEGAAISINFAGAGSLATTDTAGVVSVANWNNVTVAPPATTSALKDDSGAVTTASVTTQNLAGLLFNFGGYSSAAADAIMLNGAVFAAASATPLDTVDVTGIPYTHYDVYVYANQGTTGVGRTTNFKIGATTLSLTTVTPYSPVPPYDDATVDGNGNYVHFTGLTGASFSLFVNDTATLAAISGVEIVQTVQTPEPTSFVLCGLGAVGMFWVACRHRAC